MNKENAKDFLPLVQALADGKTIQINVGTETFPEWIATSKYGFGKPLSHYRIKPEPKPPKWREWKPEEVPVGAQLRQKGRDGASRVLILGVMETIVDEGGDVLTFCLGELGYMSREQCLKQDEHSTDGGKTWHPCGVLEVGE